MAFSREQEAEIQTRKGKILRRATESLAVSQLGLTMRRAEFSEAPVAD